MEESLLMKDLFLFLFFVALSVIMWQLNMAVSFTCAGMHMDQFRSVLKGALSTITQQSLMGVLFTWITLTWIVLLLTLLGVTSIRIQLVVMEGSCT